MHVFTTTEIAAALLQAAVTLGLAGLFLYLHYRYRKPHFLWWAVAWALYSVRLGAIISFLATDSWSWLYWHQVATGWTALGFLWAALVFSRQQPWRPGYLWLFLLPPVWAWVAIFRLDDFVLAAGTTVTLLSLATGWTGVVFLQYRRRTGSAAAGILAGTLLLWAVHHLDYPLLRARGAWNPWGYYLDLLFVLAMGGGILLLVIEELRRGLQTLATLSGELRPRDRGDALESLLRRPLALRGVEGAALLRREGGDVVPVRSVGTCGAWVETGIPDAVRALAREALALNQPVLRSQLHPQPGSRPFTAVLPLAGGEVGRALVVEGEVAAPFAALDDRILVAVGEQIGAALENAELYGALQQRTADLERLSVRMIQQHEEQRRRLARELHDETAQVFAGLKLHVGSLREAAPADLAGRFDRLMELVNAGTRSIRNVSEDLRPALLDDLGLAPALRALVSDFREWSGMETELTTPARLPPLPSEVELALFRAVQEGLSNAARHAQAERVAVRLIVGNGAVALSIEDDGVGLPPAEIARLASGPGRSGLFGMRERMASLGGQVTVTAGAPRGLRLRIEVPDGGPPTAAGG
jgi:signal transduction histidine kinase